MFSSTFTGLLALAAFAPGVIAACNRTALLEFADAYVFAHENGQVSNLENIADNFTYIENNKTHEITSGIFYNAFVIDHRHTIADTVECATYTELIITRNASGASTPHVIGTQIRHNAADMSCYLIDLLVSGPGSWLFNATQTLYWARRESWSPIDEARRDSRQKLKAAADAYLDMWSNKSAVDAVPWGTPCARLEGSVYTGNGGPNDSCKPGIPTNNNQAPNSHRRYVIDESYGAIDVMCIFEHLANAPDSHEFRMENGKLRYIHTITLANSNVVHP
ncbi:putative V-type ATP synthase alpha chain [Rosellinia necatrix]|uniref:Putative V-type ATP synthase alpha chain n=1 Tax=Rosellinia necatrix TaxID=77044 RepID=A0A1W2TIB2_ROSNE|nr:putative V-type ATP synthase alpha chain [Rosellinia necatrix]